jgi:hypothetical protein
VTTAGTTAAPSTTSTIPATTRATTDVSTPGAQGDPDLAIHVRFRSEVDDYGDDALETIAMAILTDRRGWGRAGFTFRVDETSALTVVLAEPPRVDELCLPLETRGAASCQNGAVVALNAELWRNASDDWDATVDDYRTYLVNHEVGHLLGLRHPRTRCPADAPRSAVMEPQTGGLVCAGNGWPLDWEIEWASNRPAEIGPLPEWDGPRPVWPE